uniref:Neurotransmitter-gated ion-channel ligand-binding domain-containing protein n=1 Tax=Plectus sambesii TaxID=2011161 RepID=A0A914VBD3_9BILA
MTSQATDSATAIYDQIFQDYRKGVRPVKNSSQATLVTFEIEYLTILGMNGAQESIEVHIDYEMTWIDEHLTWHPSDFADPVKSLVVPQSDIWQPDITLYELLESAPLIPEEKMKARVDFDGRVTVYNPQIMTLSCKMKIDLFPFDSQKCRMAFGPWVYQQNEVAIEESNSTIADMTMWTRRRGKHAKDGFAE